MLARCCLVWLWRLLERCACCAAQKPLYSLAKFIQDRQQWVDGARMRISNSQPLLSSYSLQQAYSNGSQAGDTKRRRKTPPVSPEESTGECMLLRRAPVSPRC